VYTKNPFITNPAEQMAHWTSVVKYIMGSIDVVIVVVAGTIVPAAIFDDMNFSQD
jgi:hypothetical protein